MTWTTRFRAELAADLRTLAPELGAGQQHDGAGVGQAVAHGVRAEGGEQRPDDAAGLQRAEDGGVELRDAVEEDEDAVALLDAEVRRTLHHLFESLARSS